MPGNHLIMANTVDLHTAMRQTQTVVSLDNLFFLLIILAGIFLTYLAALAIDIFSRYLEDKKYRAGWIFDIALQPFLMCILNISYGIAFTFLALPPAWKNAIDNTPAIVLFINLMWLIYGVFQSLIFNWAARLPNRIKRLLQFFIVLVLAAVVVIIFYQSITAVMTSAGISLLFLLIIDRIVIMRKPKVVEKPFIPKKMVVSHIFISGVETHDRIAGAIELIKAAIIEVPNTGKDPVVTLSGFVPGAFDLTIKYFIDKIDQFDAVRNEVNLNIIRHLNNHGIKINMS